MAVVLHRIWVSETDFDAAKAAAKEEEKHFQRISARESSFARNELPPPGRRLR
jgi:hypothetical protein